MKNANGFTLIELIIAIVIIAILALGAVARLPDTTLNLSGQADQLASDIRLVQSMAMTRGQRFRINFNAGGPPSTYQIVAQDGTANVVHPVTTTTGSISLASTVATTNAFIVFDGKGTPYSDAVTPGTPLAGLGATITLTKDGQSRTVTIQPGTGRVQVP